MALEAYGRLLYHLAGKEIGTLRDFFTEGACFIN